MVRATWIEKMNWQDLMRYIKTIAMKLNSKWFPWALLIAAITCIFFLPVLRGEFLLWDDWTLFVENPCYRGLSPSHWQWMCTTVLLGHWQPLSWLSYALDYKAWGMNPQGWHAANLLLHAVNAVLVYLLCLAFLKENRRRYAVAALTALFWAVHPLRVEAVAWLSTRGYLLCGTFSLLTVLFYLKFGGTRFVASDSCGHDRAWPSRVFYLAALLCFALATFTKGIGMMLPLVLLLLDWHRAWGAEHGADGARAWGWWRKRFVEKIPFFALSLLTGIAAFLAKKTSGGMVSVEQYGPIERFGQSLYGIWFYLLKTISPLNLSPLYYKRPDEGQVMTAVVFSVSALIFLFLFRKKLYPVIGALGAFLLLIFPMLGFTQSGAQMVADRFTYLATVPLSVLFAAGLIKLTARYRIIYGALTALLLIFGVQTFVWAGTWADSLLLWNHAVVRDANNATAIHGLGRALLCKNSFEKALVLFDRAIQINPAYFVARHNRALALAQLGRFEEAFSEWNVALSIPGSPEKDRAKTFLIRGWVFEQTGNLSAAEADYSTIINNLAENPEGLLNALQLRADLYVRTGRLVLAEADCLRLLALPDPGETRHEKARMVLSEIKKIPRE